LIIKIALVIKKIVMTEIIKEILEKIYFNTKDQGNDSSLMSGKAGELIFKYLYLKHFKVADAESDFQNSIQSVVDKSRNYHLPTFCGGKSGINWAFAFLHKNEILDKEDFDLLRADDEKLSKIAIWMLEKDNYDFLHGAIGIGYSLLYSRGENFSPFFVNFFDLFEKILDKSSDKQSIPYYDFQTNQIITNKVNLGLAHGIPSVLKFSLQCYVQNVNKKEAKAMAVMVSEYLINHINKDISSNYFASIISIDTDDYDPKSRLAWCYGDLGIGFILFQAGLILKKKEITNLALEILMQTIKRVNLSEALIFDAGICHGSSGVAHIYHKMWQYTKNIAFKEACNFWMAKTIDFYLRKDGLDGFRKFNPRSNSYEENNSLLEGKCGIGLVLLSYLTEDFSWDYCLMLNN
jgi:hypothetical protein